MPILVRYLNCMRDSKPQRCVQQLKSLKMTQNATNRAMHINEASIKIFCQHFFQNIMQIHVRYAFQLEDLFQCHQYTNL